MAVDWCCMKTRGSSFIFGLDNYLKSQHSRLKDVFDTFDRDQRGTLDKVEVAALVRAPGRVCG